MAVTLISNTSFKGDVKSLPISSAPMPAAALLYADFINGLYIDRIGGTVSRTTDINSRINIFRGSHANYIDESGGLAEANNSICVIDRHPQTLAKLGLRTENRVTNYMASPLDFTASTWAKTGVSAAALNGYWYTLTELAGYSQHCLRDTTTQLSTSNANVISIFVKPGTADRIQLAAVGGGAGSYANFDLTRGAVVFTGTGLLSALIEPGHDNSWRCSIVLNNPPAATADFRVSFINSDNDVMTPEFTGTGRTLQVAIAQAERAMVVPTSPITFVTRSLDVTTLLPDIPAESKADFSLFISGTMPGSPRGDDGGNNLFTLYNATTSEFVSVGQGSRRGNYRYMPLMTHNIGGAFTPVGFTGKGYESFRQWPLLITVKGGTVKVMCNGADGVQTLMTNAVNGFEKILLGRGLDSALAATGVWGGCIAKLAFFDKALSDTEMVSQFSALY
ncbi:hypothetical protein IBT47_10745 [Erwinia sp. S43]|uniref:phage head spike fiber domain-containing protein n=1 Tax=Erwinia sp. S43 TaxID=2769339 RepID=UPI00190DB927|nr:hypothetical protein [Erwinia sp. S43]MBK0032759.1 hypothetical protein [Erwinia sp. S43]